MQIDLPDLTATRRFGHALAQAAIASGHSCLILMEGDLGAGKTTLTRFLVESLPGGGEAEVTSPSFTLCNIYPTRPEVWHYDLYRLEDPESGIPPDDDLLEALEYFDNPPAVGQSGGQALMLVEWPERLPAEFLPSSFIHCRLTAEQNDRRAFLAANGKNAQEFLQRLAEFLC